MELAKRLLVRLGMWRRENLQTVPPELAACEYDCREKVCDEDRFEHCERRLHTAEVLQAAAAAEDAAAATGRGDAPLVHPATASVAGAEGRIAPPNAAA